MTLSADLLPWLGLLLAGGALAGVIAGLLGVGGGIVIVPLLYHLFDFQGIAPDLAMPLAVGTSLSTIVLTSWVSARHHHQQGGVDWELARRWSLPVLGGVVLGAALAQGLSGMLLRQSFGTFLALVSLHMLITSRPTRNRFAALPRAPVQYGLAALVGSVSSMLGIGGGTLVVPLLSLCSYPIHQAVATASVFGFIISLPATLVYVLGAWGTPGMPPGTTGYVNWIAFAALVPATTLFAPLGVKLAYRLNVVQLRRAFAVFLLAVGMKMVLV